VLAAPIETDASRSGGVAALRRFAPRIPRVAGSWSGRRPHVGGSFLGAAWNRHPGHHLLSCVVALSCLSIGQQLRPPVSGILTSPPCDRLKAGDVDGSGAAHGA